MEINRTNRPLEPLNTQDMPFGPTPSERAKSTSRTRATFAALALLMVGLAAGRQVAWWPARVRYPGELDTVEGRELADMVMLRKGVPVYAPVTPERFNAVGYGPLFYLLGSELIHPQHPSYLPLRILAAIGTLGLAAGCGLLAWWISQSYLAAIFAPLLFLSYFFTTLFGVAVHSDSVALLLWFGGFLVAYRFRLTHRVLLAVPPLVLGVFYKGQ